jgi:hypothetical protein
MVDVSVGKKDTRDLSGLQGEVVPVAFLEFGRALKQARVHQDLVIGHAEVILGTGDGMSRAKKPDS